MKSVKHHYQCFGALRDAFTPYFLLSKNQTGFLYKISIMDEAKRKLLEQKGWKVGNVSNFLELIKEETANLRRCRFQGSRKILTISYPLIQQRQLSSTVNT